ncbi:hypothetical protein BYT27DRAFT_6665507 [Phlegmacium glaucopus]|nr:hypothetical protein BYT27DRAFT_6665507 [Phlegmacium glaucopus]
MGPPRSTNTDIASIIMYSPRTSADDLISTSSLQGLYIRSRPTSVGVPTDSLGMDFGGFCQTSFNGNLQSIQITEQALQPILTSSESSQTIATSVKTTASKNAIRTLALRRHFNMKGDQGSAFFDIEGDDSSGVPEIMKDQSRAQRTLKIPDVYRAVSKKVYGVFHRKAHSTPESIQGDSHFPDNSVNDRTAAPIREPKPAEPIKSSSVSLFTRNRRPTIGREQDPHRSKRIFSPRALSIRRNQNSSPAPNIVSATSTSLAIENHACLRRSLSVSGIFDPPELDSELDEATAEATQVASATIRWANVHGRSRMG